MRAKQPMKVKIPKLTLSTQVQKMPKITTRIPSVNQSLPKAPKISMGPQLLTAIKQSPKGVLPPSLAKYTKGGV